ncbi:cell surface protein [Ruminococcus albus SY3]|uniref:Cell surface protein n=1 Tax=Ruminococcus albus SY3 TaxID=1341156 RepID=A0A011UG81_RUMAL|nr:leucine-rich repeat domain-containing protein [Ruminococcus albus]EXM39679.1 cell surface protein [Ruminococcus albus SY3]
MKSKKIISGLLALTFVLGGTALPNTVVNNSVVASAATKNVEVFTYGDYDYIQLEDGTVEIAKYNGTDEVVEIPGEIDGAAVTSIGEHAFDNDLYDNNSNITSVTIPEGVTNIGFRAFFECKSLVEVSIPDGVVTIGGQAFHTCEKLREVIIPDSVETLGGGAFGFCKALESVALSNKLTKINDNTFTCCEKLTSIKLPSGIKSIGAEAFTGCKNLESINLPDGLTTISRKAFTNCSKIKELTVPASVTSMNSSAFEKTNIDQFYFYNNSAIANNVKIALSKGSNFKVFDCNDKTEYPIPCSAEFNSEFHQFRLNWTEVEGAEKYAIAVYLAGKWRPQVYFKANETSFTSPKLKPNTYRMVICARVNGEWNTAKLENRASYVKVR